MSEAAHVVSGCSTTVLSVRRSTENTFSLPALTMVICGSGGVRIVVWTSARRAAEQRHRLLELVLVAEALRDSSHRGSLSEGEFEGERKGV